jgi:aerobic-type carbon monoxide dehydrogenase small subunit (CoxS/CutS family)
MERVALNLRVNGQAYRVEVAPDRFLVDVLRDDLGLLGVKEACDEGECGACTVLLDGRAVDSCILLALQAQGAEVVTVEGLAAGGALHPLQEAFVVSGAVQCGYCIPGMLMGAKALLDENPAPTAEEIRLALAGNLCRCTGYNAVVAAVRAAAERLRADAGQGG